MTKNNKNELRDKILHGVSLAYKRLILAKQQEDAEVALCRDGKILIVKATELKN